MNSRQLINWRNRRKLRLNTALRDREQAEARKPRSWKHRMAYGKAFLEAREAMAYYT